jgi:hypothetical protein
MREITWAVSWHKWVSRENYMEGRWSLGMHFASSKQFFLKKKLFLLYAVFAWTLYNNDNVLFVVQVIVADVA